MMPKIGDKVYLYTQGQILHCIAEDVEGKETGEPIANRKRTNGSASG